MTTKRVLIVDDDRHLVKALTARLTNLGLEVLAAHDGITAMKVIPSKKPDLVLLDVNMPAGSGLTVCTVLAKDTELSPIPVVIMTGRSDRDTINQCEKLGAHYLKKSPALWDTLRPLVFELLDTKDPNLVTPTPTGAKAVPPPEDTTQHPKVLVIDDDPDISKALQIKLGAYGVEVVRAFNGMQGYWTALRERPDLVIVDYLMPGGRGNYILGRLKSHSITKDIPAMIVTGKTIDGKHDFALERELKSMGAERFMTKPVDFDALLDVLRHYMPIPDHPAGLPKYPKSALIGG